MTLEELEIVVTADISDVTNKLNQIKGQIEKKVEGTVQKLQSQIKPSVQHINQTISSSSSITSKEIDILNKKIDLQVRKVRELRRTYAEEMKYAKAYAESGTKNWTAPETEKARTKYVQAQIQLEKMQLQASKMQNKLADAGETTEKSATKITKAMKKASNSIKKSDKHTSRFVQTLRRMALAMAIRGLINSAREGFQDLAIANETFNKSMSQMQAGLLQAKNSITTAFAPALEALAPIVVKVADAISWLFTQIAMWGSAFSGKGTYVRAKKVTTDYAKSLGKVANEQKSVNKEQERMLASFDELNILMEKSSSGTSSETGIPSASEMFEEVAIPQEIINKAETIKQKFKELLPVLGTIGGIIAGWKIGEEIDKFGQLLGLWGNGKGKVNDLTDAFKNKNSALGDQQGEYSKELSWLKKLIPSFLGAGISVGLLGSKLKNLKENPIELPSLQPVTDMQTAFSNAKDTITSDMNTINQNVAINVDGATQKLEQAVPIIDTAVNTTGDTIIENAKRTQENINTSSSNIKNVISTTLAQNTMEIETGVTNQKKLLANGFDQMQKSAEIMSISIQESFQNFIENTANNLNNWITNSIEPAIRVMRQMNRATKTEMFNTSEASKAVQEFKNNKIVIEGTKKSIVQDIADRYNYVKETLPEIMPDWGKVLKTIGGGIAVGTGIGAGYTAMTGDTSWLANIFSQLVPAFATGGVVHQPTLALVGENSSTTPEIVTPQKLMLDTNMQANVPVMNAIEEMGDKLVNAMNSIGVYAEFDYSKLKIGLDNENYRVGGKLYGV